MLPASPPSARQNSSSSLIRAHCAARERRLAEHFEVGGWALPPLYLLTGLASPLVLVPVSASALERLAGVLTIGVGDSAASFIGSRYGRSTWRGDRELRYGSVSNVN
ncbi:Dolichol kinase [Eumeta japonica]|uniref:dolichol kinase n=1 Tax=Eumeta variegata TaxID=151549 RepID=A0A4C2AD24_EUMVA|nr:Dolichol kinase [Eumeta japonica]